MKSGRKTTYILLERGTEDLKLLNEISQLLTDEEGVLTPLSLNYPYLVELRWQLMDETQPEK